MSVAFAMRRVVMVRVASRDAASGAAKANRGAVDAQSGAVIAHVTQLQVVLHVASAVTDAAIPLDVRPVCAAVTPFLTVVRLCLRAWMCLTELRNSISHAVVDEKL